MLSISGYAIRQRSDQFAAGAIAVAALSLALVSWQAFGLPGDPAHATWIYASYALAAFLTAAISRRAEATWNASGLLLAALGGGLGVLVAMEASRSLVHMIWNAVQGESPLTSHLDGRILAFNFLGDGLRDAADPYG